MNKTKNILVTGAGGPASISFINAVAHMGHVITAADMDPFAAGLHIKSVNGNALILPGSHPHFVGHLLNLCLERCIDILVPTVDQELQPIGQHKDVFEAHGIQVMIAPLSTLHTCLDKWQLHNKMLNRVNVAHTEVMHPNINTSGLVYPLIVKPRSGSGSKGIKLIESATEFETRHFSEDWIIQSILPGAEYSVDVYVSQQGHVLAAVPRERLKIDSGVAVTARTMNDPDIIDLAKEVAIIIGLRGVANVQIKMDPSGKPALLEVNPRFPGTMALTVASGVNIPEMSVQELTGFAMDNECRPFRNIAMVRTYQEHMVDPENLEALMRIKIFKAEERLTKDFQKRYLLKEQNA